MIEFVKPFAEWCAALIEILGVGIILYFTLYSLISAAYNLAKGNDGGIVFHQTRDRLIGGVLLGLEFLVAGDIITTVAVELSFDTVSVLAIIVIIRTFLSFTLEVEMTGKWPWQHKAGEEERKSEQ